MRSARLIAILVLGTLLASGLSATAQEVPTIYLYVNDLATPGALFSFEEEDLTALCHEIDSLSTAEVAILVVNTTYPMDIDTFAFRVFEENAIGKAGEDNGVLIVVATDDRSWRIEVGYGLEPILTDAKVANYARTWLEPSLAIGDYYEGLYDVTLAIGQEIVDRYEPRTPGSEPSLWIWDWRGIVLGVVVFIMVGVLTGGRVFLWIGNVYKRGGFGGGRSGGGGARGRP